MFAISWVAVYVRLILWIWVTICLEKIYNDFSENKLKFEAIFSYAHIVGEYDMNLCIESLLIPAQMHKGLRGFPSSFLAEKINRNIIRMFIPHIQNSLFGVKVCPTSRIYHHKLGTKWKFPRKSFALKRKHNQ